MLRYLITFYFGYLSLLAICKYQCEHSCDTYKEYHETSPGLHAFTEQWFDYEEEYSDNFSMD